MMVIVRTVPLVLLLFMLSVHSISCKEEKKVSFSQEVLPLLKKRCLGCHYPGNEFNESKLAMHTYESLLAGGIHGAPIIPGNSGNSLIIKKLGTSPPFGDRMPLMSKQKLTEEEISLIARWIDQGANDN